jgi:hypothetical protein
MEQPEQPGQPVAAAYPHAECTSNRCQAPIIWTVTERRRDRMPVNRTPDPAGVILLLPNPDDPLVPIARVEGNAGKRFAKTCYTSHFATCPDADRFRQQTHRRQPRHHH